MLLRGEHLPAVPPSETLPETSRASSLFHQQPVEAGVNLFECTAGVFGDNLISVPIGNVAGFKLDHASANHTSACVYTSRRVVHVCMRRRWIPGTRVDANFPPIHTYLPCPRTVIIARVETRTNTLLMSLRAGANMVSRRSIGPACYLGLPCYPPGEKVSCDGDVEYSYIVSFPQCKEPRSFFLKIDHYSSLPRAEISHSHFCLQRSHTLLVHRAGVNAQILIPL